MARSTLSILILLAFVAYEQSFVEGACPMTQKGGEDAMKRCLASVGLSTDPAGMGPGNAEQFKQYCKDGSLNQALTCVQEMLDDCAAENPEMGATMKKALSIDNLRAGFKHLCDNVDVLQGKEQCIRDASGGMGACVQAESQKYQAEVQTRAQAGDLKESDIWELTCGLMDRVFACQNNAYEAACGSKVAEVLMSFMQALRPPVCAEYSSAMSVITSSWVMLFGLLVTLLFNIKS